MANFGCGRSSRQVSAASMTRGGLKVRPPAWRNDNASLAFVVRLKIRKCSFVSSLLSHHNHVTIERQSSVGPRRFSRKPSVFAARSVSEGLCLTRSLADASGYYFGSNWCCPVGLTDSAQLITSFTPCGHCRLDIHVRVLAKKHGSNKTCTINRDLPIGKSYWTRDGHECPSYIQLQVPLPSYEKTSHSS